MSINIAGSVGIPLTVFGSWVTEVSPESVPENISPDNQDVIYAPGEVSSRPGMQRVFSTPFPAGGKSNLIPTVMYEKSFVTPTGDIKNLYFDSNGVLWVEDLTNSPGAYIQILQSTPGSFCKSITSFGREYIAISDGLHGSDIPWQYDGTYLDRVTQDGPGEPPTVANTILPAQSTATTSTSTNTISTIITSGLVVPPPQYERPPAPPYYTSISISFTTTANFSVGQSITVSGNSAINGVFSVSSVSGNVVTAYYYSASYISGTGGSAGTSAITLSRANNTVTAATPSANSLQVGYQVQITNVAASVVGTSITSIVVNNENMAGIATVTTSTAHGLSPNNNVTITGVNPVAVGSTISSAVRAGDTVTITTSTAHGQVPGSQVQLVGVTDTSFDGSFTVAIVPSPTQLVYQQTDADSTSSGGSVLLIWPIPDDTPTPTYFEVVSAPTPTTFQVQVITGDGTWTSGSVSFAWNGIFYVTATLSSTLFQYQQYGPNISTSSTGTITPYGQIAPGLHLCQVLFLTRQGAITAPSPPTTFIAEGGQYITITNIPTGPPNIIGRILAFTGAQPNVPGELPPFFYIPSTPQLEGQIVGTATQINDNTTISITLDFSDPTLYAALGISIPGNTLANQIVLDGALGFSAYGSRLLTIGQRNRVNNLLNMGFDGGQMPLDAYAGQNHAPGWSSSPSGTANEGIVVSTGVRFGYGWLFSYTTPQSGSPTGIGIISQNAYEDSYGDPILTGNTLYSYRLWANSTAASTGTMTIVVNLYSPTLGILATASIPVIWGTYGFVQATFNTKTPNAIPADTVLQVSGSYTGAASNTFIIVIDEMSLIYAETPFNETIAMASYINNPEGMDGVSGQYGPSDDTAKIMDQNVLRDTLYIITRDPSGRLHETNGSSTSEPSGWSINEVASNCGTLSAFGMTHSQADNTAASGGDDWMSWPSEGGAMIFGGGLPAKISQEIQPNWYDPTKTNAAVQINSAAAISIWGMNDPVQRLLMFGLPIGTATAPNQIYVLNYRNLNNSSAIESSPPFHPSFAGKLIATDNSRKWTRWNISANSAVRIYRMAGELSLSLCGGNGQVPGAAAGYGNVYTLNPALATDQDYGNFSPYYTTYFFLDPEKAAALQITAGRIMLAYWSSYVSGSGNLTVAPLIDNLGNAWPLTVTRALSATPNFDMEGGGGYAQGNRIAVKITVSAGGSFSLSRLMLWIKNARMQIGGRAQ